MKKILSIISIINSLLLISIIIYLVYNHFTIIDANDIMKMNIDSIVEVKASTDSIGESYGTGIIYSSDGYIITNSHVVSYTSLGETKLFDNYEVRFAKDEEYVEVSYIRMDTTLDLAILKILDESKSYIPITFGDSNYTYGDTIYAIGNTSNYGIGISEGIISVPEVNITYDDITRTVIQADINISSGNSGGALLNKEGKLIGITTFRTKDNQGNVNYGFTYSIPIRIINEYILEENVNEENT